MVFLPRIGPAIGDNFTGLTMTVGILMAYYNRLNTGKGQYIDVAMLDTCSAYWKARYSSRKCWTKR